MFAGTRDVLNPLPDQASAFGPSLRGCGQIMHHEQGWFSQFAPVSLPRRQANDTMRLCTVTSSHGDGLWDFDTWLGRLDFVVRCCSSAGRVDFWEICAVSSPHVGFKGFRPRRLSIVSSRQVSQWQFAIVPPWLVQRVCAVRLKDIPERVEASVRPCSFVSL